MDPLGKSSVWSLSMVAHPSSAAIGDFLIQVHLSHHALNEKILTVFIVGVPLPSRAIFGERGGSDSAASTC